MHALSPGTPLHCAQATPVPDLRPGHHITIRRDPTELAREDPTAMESGNAMVKRSVTPLPGTSCRAREQDRSDQHLPVRPHRGPRRAPGDFPDRPLRSPLRSSGTRLDVALSGWLREPTGTATSGRDRISPGAQRGCRRRPAVGRCPAWRPHRDVMPRPGRGRGQPPASPRFRPARGPHRPPGTPWLPGRPR